MRKSNLKVFIFGLLILSATILHASGLGIAIPIGFGKTDYDWYKADAIQGGFCFIFDTNVARKSLFNYRLSVGLESFNHDYMYDILIYDWNTDTYVPGQANGERKGSRIVTDHAFGFGILKSSIIRLWMGPTLRFGFMPGKHPGLTIGVGITALGLNFNLGSLMTVAFEAGYSYALDSYFDPIDTRYDYDTYYLEDSIDKGLNSMFIAKLSVLIRLHDVFDEI